MKNFTARFILLAFSIFILLSSIPFTATGGGASVNSGFQIYDFLGYVVSPKKSAGRSLWYLHPYNNTSYQVGDAMSATRVVKEFGIRLKRSEIEKIPLGDFDHLPKLKISAQNQYSPRNGEILIEKESNKPWYVFPIDGKRYSLEDPRGPQEALRKLALPIFRRDLQKIPKGNLTSRKLKKFTSAKQFDRYVAALKKEQKKKVEATGGAEGGGCFLQGTLILMADGSQKPIEYIRVGDKILTKKNDFAAELVEDTVTKTFEHIVDEYLIINGSLRVTPIHRMFVNGHWKTAGEVSLGDWLLDAQDRRVVVSSIRKVSSRVKVYNLETKWHHTYFADNIYVHNQKGVDVALSVTEESVTNVQETGVDEGGIVKAFKNFFIILRRGRLFSVNIGDAQNANLTPISQLNVYPYGLTPANWYDELLISGNQIVVVGYSYKKTATEIGLFSINDGGVITHKATYFLDSDDYYSSRNYASRLVGSTLIFYMPAYLFRYHYSYEGGVMKTTIEPRLPRMRQWTEGDNTDEGKDVLSKVNIYKPVQDMFDPTLHTVVRCTLAGEFTCKATSILGPYARNFYVSPEAVYVWVSDWNTASYVYRMSLTEDDSAQVLRADGSPIDQFSFKEQDGFLNVLVRSEGRGDAMWNPETTTGKLALLRASLSAFKDSPNLVSADWYTALPSPKDYGVQNRFVGPYLLYGSGGPWWSYNKDQETLYAKKFASAEPVQTVALPHSIERIEVMGKGGIAIGADLKQNLGLSSLSLGDAVSVTDTYLISAASQGELRSHGYFFKQQADGSGIVGLPIRYEGTAIRSYLDDSAGVAFLNVDAAQKFTSLGSLASPPEKNRNDDCQTSCVDWYGNARPIFYSGRIFALLGYELIEGRLAEGAITELQKITFLN